MTKKTKALALLSGGLDSALAAKIVKDQGIEVIALNLTSPFCTCIRKGCSIAALAKGIGLPVKIMHKGQDYLDLIRNPKFKYGKGINPCIDCRIYTLKKAKKFAKEIGADFIFTGEVLGQRPMSQHLNALNLIEKEAGLIGKILRPLSAGLLQETEAEKKGLIDRKKLLSLEGRTRKPQLDIAKQLKIHGFLCGGSGCKLTEKEFSIKLKDLFNHQKKVTEKDVRLLAIGRHFRINDNKIIVGRNEEENNLIKKYKGILFEPKTVKGPTTLLQGKPNKKAIILASSLTARYSDSKDDIIVKYGKKEIISEKLSEKELENLRVK